MSRDPGAAWERYKAGAGPLHDLTVTIATAIHKAEHEQSWDYASERDPWLAVGSWIAAEAVVAVLPLAVSP